MKYVNLINPDRELCSHTTTTHPLCGKNRPNSKQNYATQDDRFVTKIRNESQKKETSKNQSRNLTGLQPREPIDQNLWLTFRWLEVARVESMIQAASLVPRLSSATIQRLEIGQGGDLVSALCFVKKEGLFLHTTNPPSKQKKIFFVPFFHYLLNEIWFFACMEHF